MARRADFVELDVQITKDGVPVIWHDDWIHYRHLNGGDGEVMVTQTIRELTIAEFRQISYAATVCPQKQVVLMRKFKDNSSEFRPWICRQEDELPPLQEVLTRLPESDEVTKNTITRMMPMNDVIDASGSASSMRNSWIGRSASCAAV